MTREWTRKPESELPSQLEDMISGVDHNIHDAALHWHWSHWHPISTAPCNRDLEVRVVEGSETGTLPFPCRHLNAGEWINADLGTRILIAPTEWRVWQHGQSPHPHRTAIRVGDREP